MLYRILRSPEPADPAGGDPNPKPEPKAPEPKPEPASPVVVKKTPLKTPREIQLEKDVSSLQDRLDGLESWRGEVNGMMAELGLGKAPSPAPALKDKQPAKKKGFFDEIAADLGIGT